MNLREKLLKTTDDVKKSLKVPFQVRKDKKQLESWLIDKEEEEANLQLKIQEAKASDNLNIDNILDMIDDLELVTRRIKQGNALMKELFETEVSK